MTICRAKCFFSFRHYIYLFNYNNTLTYITIFNTYLYLIIFIYTGDAEKFFVWFTTQNLTKWPNKIIFAFCFLRNFDVRMRTFQHSLLFFYLLIFDCKYFKVVCFLFPNPKCRKVTRNLMCPMVGGNKARKAVLFKSSNYSKF